MRSSVGKGRKKRMTASGGRVNSILHRATWYSFPDISDFLRRASLVAREKAEMRDKGIHEDIILKYYQKDPTYKDVFIAQGFDSGGCSA